MADLNFRNVQNLCARVDMMVEKPEVDLSSVTWFEPYALIYLGMFLRYHNRLGKSFKLVQPAKKDAKDYLTRQNFWRRFNFSPHPANDRQSLKLFTGTSFNDIVDLVDDLNQAEDVATRLEDLLHANSVRVNTRPVTEAVTEIVQNFVEHAREGLAGMMAQYYPNQHSFV